MRRRQLVATSGAALVLAVWLRRRYPGFRPFTLLLGQTEALRPETRSRLQKLIFKAVYATMNMGLRRADVGFLNYGYTPLDDRVEPLELSPEHEPDRYSIQLYDK